MSPQRTTHQEGVTQLLPEPWLGPILQRPVWTWLPEAPTHSTRGNSPWTAQGKAIHRPTFVKQCQRQGG